MIRRAVWAALATAALGLFVAVPSVAAAPPAEPDVETQPSGEGLLDVPVGCPAPDPADVAFVGTAVAKDFEKVRFQIVQLRAGSVSGYSIDGLVDVLYFDDAKFFDVGDDYLVGARFDEDFGELASTVRPPEPLFGGNDVIGLNDTDIDCPTIDDPVRTVQPDGESVDSGILSPMFDDTTRLLATIGVPFGIVFGALLGLVLLRHVWHFFISGIFELGRSAVTPIADHKSVRTREHREGDARS